MSHPEWLCHGELSSTAFPFLPLITRPGRMSCFKVPSWLLHGGGAICPTQILECSRTFSQFKQECRRVRGGGSTGWAELGTAVEGGGSRSLGAVTKPRLCQTGACFKGMSQCRETEQNKRSCRYLTHQDAAFLTECQWKACHQGFINKLWIPWGRLFYFAPWSLSSRSDKCSSVKKIQIKYF